MQVYFMASSILQESIEEINKEFPDEWNETISLIKKLCAKEGVELSIFNAIQGKGIFLEEKHKEYAIEYLNKELRQAKVEGYYDEMNFAIIIHQKTGIISNSGVKKYRVGMCSSIQDGVFPVDKDRMISIAPKLDDNLNSESSVYYGFLEFLKILRID